MEAVVPPAAIRAQPEGRWKGRTERPSRSVACSRQAGVVPVGASQRPRASVPPGRTTRQGSQKRATTLPQSSCGAGPARTRPHAPTSGRVAVRTPGACVSSRGDRTRPQRPERLALAKRDTQRVARGLCSLRSPQVPRPVHDMVWRGKLSCSSPGSWMTQSSDARQVRAVLRPADLVVAVRFRLRMRFVILRLECGSRIRRIRSSVKPTKS